MTSEAGLRRSLSLLRAFRLEQSDPDYFYRFQAADSMVQIARYMDVAAKLVLDIGGGAGYFTEAFRARGARCFLIEPEAGASSIARSDPAAPLTPAQERHRRAVAPARLVPESAVAGDGNCLPFPDGVADVTFSSNVLEHVSDPARFLDESVRVTRPGGLIYLSFTSWYSPWGGHETAPWHYFGGARAARRYEALNGRPPGNLFGTSMYATHIGPVLRLARSHRQVEVVSASPRYYPDWMRWLIRVPGLREVAAWNLLVIMRRRPAVR